MSDDAYSSGHRARRRRRIGERLLIISCLSMTGAAVFGRILLPANVPPAASVRPEPPAATSPEPEPVTRPGRMAWILDPAPMLGFSTPRLGQERSRQTAIAPSIATTTPVDVTPAQTPQPQRVVQIVPLPKPRPAALRDGLGPTRLAEHTTAPTAPLAAPEDTQAERSFFETVFGAKPATGPTLAYAPLDNDAVDPSPRRSLGLGFASTASGRTAVYDISARMVTLPNGERLEAHSGLGASQDDPRYVHLRMRGATPPGTYDLREREALFHGVRAIRLNPVGGTAATFGRNGLLAHTFMLGRSGASNGCISFRNYDRFLQAFLRGDVRRVVVVAGNGKDRFPSLAETPVRRGGRYAEARADR